MLKAYTKLTTGLIPFIDTYRNVVLFNSQAEIERAAKRKRTTSPIIIVETGIFPEDADFWSKAIVYQP